MVTEVEKAYIAGILDGEGSFIIYSCDRPENRAGITYKVSVQIANTGLEMLEWVQSLYGGHINIGSRAGEVRKHNIVSTKTCYKWIVSGESSRAITQDVLPYLRMKSKQAKNILDFLPLASSSFLKRDSSSSALEKHKLYVFNRYLNSSKLTQKQRLLIKDLVPLEETGVDTSTAQSLEFPIKDFEFRDRNNVVSEAVCSIHGCKSKHYAKGFCRRHYRHEFESITKSTGKAIRSCLQCNSDISNLRIDRKFCCVACKAKWHRKQKKIKPL